MITVASKEPQILPLLSECSLHLVRRTIAVEHECCPFFTLAYDAAEHRLAITVEDWAQDPALDALHYSLGANR
jgi:hypothetical protein